MNWEIEDCAWTTAKWLPSPKITGVIFKFHGLGAPGLRVEMEPHEWEWTKAGALVVFPYYGPWSWMNRSARAFCDELVDKIWARHKLAANVPLISTGGSMGGLSGLLYTRYAKKPVTACAVNSAVCDLAYHFRERPDVGRSVFCAFQGYAEDLETALAETSPLAQAANMPRIPYYLSHGTADKAVNKERHSDAFVLAMRRLGHTVQYVEMPEVQHEEPPQYREPKVAWVKKFLLH